MAAYMRGQQEEVLGGDRLTSRDTRPSRMAHDGDPVFFCPPDLVYAVGGIQVAAEPELGQVNSCLLQVNEVLFLQCRFKDNGTGVDGHAVGVEVIEALFRCNGESFDSYGGAWPAGCVDFAGGYD